MRKGKKHIVKKWLLAALFASYAASISFFTHTHVVGHIAYVHSHPYKKSEKAQHSHTTNQLFFLDHIFHTQIIPDVVPEFDLSDKSNVWRNIQVLLYESFHRVKNQEDIFLRAPPVAA